MRSFLLLLSFLLITGFVSTACENGTSEFDGGVEYTAEELCEENWDPANGNNGRLVQPISVTFRVPDEFPISDASDSASLGVRLALVTAPDVPIEIAPKAYGILNRALILVPGELVTYHTEFLDRPCAVNAEICGASFYIVLEVYSDPQYPDSANWVYVSEAQYQVTGGECIAIEDAELVSNLPS